MKEYNYCPYCGEKLHTFEVKTRRGTDEIDEKILDEKNLVLIDLKNESMRVPFSLNGQDNLLKIDEYRGKLVKQLKETIGYKEK